MSSIQLTFSEDTTADKAEAAITPLLHTRHKLDTEDDDDFSISSVSEITETLEETTQTMTLLLGAIAGISLLVGGIGVMNIMLVFVLETYPGNRYIESPGCQVKRYLDSVPHRGGIP